MDVAEKAKRYDEAIKRAKEMYAKFEGMKQGDILEDVFPELKESEDEKIRKKLIAYFVRYKEQAICGVKTFYGIPSDKILAWLEKQGEQKSSWSEEDISKIDRLIMYFKGKDNKEFTEWFSLLKDRVLPQPTWKPSDAQIEALESATENCAYSEYQDCLRELIGQLKKLKAL